MTPFTLHPCNSERGTAASSLLLSVAPSVTEDLLRAKRVTRFSLRLSTLSRPIFFVCSRSLVPAHTGITTTPVCTLRGLSAYLLFTSPFSSSTHSLSSCVILSNVICFLLFSANHCISESIVNKHSTGMLSSRANASNKVIAVLCCAVTFFVLSPSPLVNCPLSLSCSCTQIDSLNALLNASHLFIANQCAAVCINITENVCGHTLVFKYL